MIASNTTIPSGRPPYVYGEILSRSLYNSPRAELPSLGTFLSQGAATGALLGFSWPVIGMLDHPDNGYNFMLISFLPEFLFGGAFVGLCEGIMLWLVTFAAGRRIHPLIRAVLGIVLVTTILTLYTLLFTGHSLSQHWTSMANDLIGLYAGSGLVFGLVVGSKIRPISELIRGATAERWPVMTALTGFALRPLVIFALMVSILFLILSLQGDFHRSEFVMSLIAVSHFAVALVIIFARTPFWLLLPLALIINFPVAALVTDVLKPDDVFSALSLLTISDFGALSWCVARACRRRRSLSSRENSAITCTSRSQPMKRSAAVCHNQSLSASAICAGVLSHKKAQKAQKLIYSRLVSA